MNFGPGDSIHTERTAKVEIKTGLSVLRKQFEPHQIGKLPKPTKQQTEAVKADFRKGVRCSVCHTWHHPDVQHLDYVGHAALTDRLLDADPLWTWAPLAFDSNGLPLRDGYGGMWVHLTVCGHTRLGYGHTDKTGGDAVKELIGDALRNAAMRFGAALDLWHKGELHKSELPEPSDNGNEAPDTAAQPWLDKIAEAKSAADLVQLGADIASVCPPPAVRSIVNPAYKARMAHFRARVKAKAAKQEPQS